MSLCDHRFLDENVEVLRHLNCGMEDSPVAFDIISVDAIGGTDEKPHDAAGAIGMATGREQHPGGVLSDRREKNVAACDPNFRIKVLDIRKRCALIAPRRIISLATIKPDAFTVSMPWRVMHPLTGRAPTYSAGGSPQIG